MTTSAPSVQYTQALAKGGALLTETRLLLDAWQPGESEGELAQRALDQDLLGRATARRVLDIVRVFALRFLTPDDRPARHLKVLASRASDLQPFSDLVLFYTAGRDALLRDFLVTRFWPSVREGRLVISNKEMQQLIRDAEQDGRIPAPWSAEIKRDMAGRVMIALTDFGLLRPLKPATREVVPYRLSDGAAVYLAYLLHGQGVTDASLADQEAWAMFGLLPGEVWGRLERLASDGWFEVQRAGHVARITWAYGSVKEVVDALAR